MVYSYWAELGPRQEQRPAPKQWGTIGLNPCPGSGAMWKCPHSFIKPIYSRYLFQSRFRPVWIRHKDIQCRYNVHEYVDVNVCKTFTCSSVSKASNNSLRVLLTLWLVVSLAVSSLLPAPLPPASSDRFRFPFGNDSLSCLVGRGGRAGARLGISPAPPATLSTILSRLPDVTGSDNRADYKYENQTVYLNVGF